MPYSGPDDESLPSNVKKLGDKQRRQWVRVYNGAHSRCKAKGGKDCEAFAFRNANGVLKNASTTFAGMLGGEHALGRSFIEFSAAEPPETINIFPAPGSYKHPLWGDMEVTEEGNQKFIDNFAAQVYQEHIPIDAEHKSKLSGAVGYIRSLDLNEDGSIEAGVEWTDRGQKLIEGDGYQYISPEWYEEWSDPATESKFENVLIGGALTNRPFFKDMRALIASEGRLYDVEDGERTPVIRSSIEGVSYEDLRTMILSAARHEFPGVLGTGDYSGWVADLFDDHVIIEASGKYWHIDYTYSEDVVTFSGQPSEVQRKSFWEDVVHQAKEAERKRKSNTTTKNKTKDSKEAHMTTADVERLASDVEELGDKDKMTILQRLASAVGFTVKVGHEEETDNKDESDADTKDKAEDDDKETRDEPEGDPKTAVEITTLQTALKASEDAREASDKRLSGLEATERTRRYRDIILGRDEAGLRQAQESSIVLRPMVGDLAQKQAVMEALAIAKGEDSDEFKAYVASEREHASAIHAAGTFSEAGIDSQGATVESTAEGEVKKRIAEKRASDNTLTEDAAIALVANEDPALYEKYDREKTGRRSVFPRS